MVYTDEPYLQSRNRDTDVKNGRVDIEVEEGMNWESSIDMYIHYHV